MFLVHTKNGTFKLSPLPNIERKNSMNVSASNTEPCLNILFDFPTQRNEDAEQYKLPSQK